ncbi:hypothetical protein [Asticcacaulis benevestitus]|uniref:Uncharacterized protein n=1 Tax=Asticcacaulis benevestitus DSM 16100 = ATCC BAA-896 TaxID=1121022 RepID=V4Q3Z3_9CAUL|nr:hypothetical protein [Asticcacaulis benevestitus]ESQ94439.1 hypothetical protein ABENE_01065 [Asticcacaulis benevestitus DSM 16100 = ATCC BAA-896]
MREADHPSTYSIDWNTPETEARPGSFRRPNALVISLAAFVMATIGSGVAVASQLSHLPDVDALPVIPEHAEAMNPYPVVERSDIVLATVNN